MKKCERVKREAGNGLAGLDLLIRFTPFTSSLLSGSGMDGLIGPVDGVGGRMVDADQAAGVVVRTDPARAVAVLDAL